MTEVALRDEGQPQQGELVPFNMNSELLLWVQEAKQAHLVAQSLAKTSFVPASLRGKPEDITAAILAGQELGLKPMASLRSMDVIQGTPALRAHAMRGLVQSKGHKVWLAEQTQDLVIYRGQRREADGSYGEVQESKWDTARAELMQLTNKPEWKKQRQTMLTARATGEICRLVASDVLHAMPYALEELDGYRIGTTRVKAEAGERITAAEILANAEPAEITGAPASPPVLTDEEKAEAWLREQQPPGEVA